MPVAPGASSCAFRCPHTGDAIRGVPSMLLVKAATDMATLFVFARWHWRPLTQSGVFLSSGFRAAGQGLGAACWTPARQEAVGRAPPERPYRRA
ncbi:hypothetical protein MTO96_020613 [Rhipicephalus appendiculatus]